MSGSLNTGWLQPTARACMRARPLPTRPIVHALARTQAPQHPLDQHTRYPKHPLTAFFHSELYRVTPSPSEGVLPNIVPASSISSPLQSAKGEVEVRLPAVLPESLFGHDASSRSYLAPELRLKSSHELHALWAHRVRKSMARIKLVLNERRLALIQAQQDVRLAQTSEDAAEAAVEDGLLNAAAATLEAEAEVGAEAEQEGSLYEEEQPERVGSATQGGGKASSSSSGRL
ncbi:unnamed protein product [Tilletia caries]|uniref:Large ribosomal subunit protein uL29m n=1 Tax=Tilletia caries TaxID=13290 RepID=A0ABN7ILI8_9BASI|nr:unnamed protein product [Tilletia caries]